MKRPGARAPGRMELLMSPGVRSSMLLGVKEGKVMAVAGRLRKIAAAIGPGAGQAVRIPRVAHSNWREEVYVVYYVGKGKFSSPPNLNVDPNHLEFYINLQMDGYDLNGNWFGYQLGVHHSQSTIEDFLRIPPPPQGAFDDPHSPVPHPDVKEYTKGVWTFADGSEIFAVGPAKSHLVPFNDGSFLFMVTTGQTITNGTGRYEGCAGIKEATGTTLIPAGVLQPGKFPIPGLEFEAKTIETFRIVKRQDMKPPPPPPPSQDQGQKEGEAQGAQGSYESQDETSKPKMKKS